MVLRPQVGLIGAGQMGAPIARRLLAANLPLTVYGRREEVTRELAALGAQVARDARGAAQGDVLIVCTFSDAQLREVVFGENGGLCAMRPGSVLMNHVTGDPRLGLEILEAAPPGVGYADAPMSGTAAQIEAGELTVLLGAEPSVVEVVRPVLETYSRSIVHVGQVGLAQKAKLLNNLLFTVNVSLAGEVLELGSQLGLEPAALARALGQCSGATGALALLEQVPFSALKRGALPFLAKDLAAVRVAAQEAPIDLGVLGELASWVDRAVGSPT